MSTTAPRFHGRQRSFKKGIDGDVTRRRREDIATQIRKSIKEDRLNQRRRMGPVERSEDGDVFDDAHGDDDDGIQPNGSTGTQRVTVKDLPRIAALIQSLDVREQIYAVSSLRRLLSLEHTPPIEEVVNLGVVPLLVSFLRRHDHPELQFEASWALTNIASGESKHTKVVVNCGGVPLFCELLLSTNDDVCDQAVWALGNIAGDSAVFRDFVLNSGAMVPLLAVLRRSVGKTSILRNATWALSNFCRGKPQPQFALVSPALELLQHLIHSPDEEIVTDACWALSYLSDGSNEKIQAVIESGVVTRIADLLGHSLGLVQTPALRTVGNIVTGSHQQTQLMLDCGVLPRLVPLLQHQKKMIRKEACWTLSNITAGTLSQIQEVIDANIIPLLVHILVTSEFDVRKEAAWAISNATSSGSVEQIKYLVSQGCIPPLINLLETADVPVINVCLDALLNILKAGDADRTIDGDNKMAVFIEEAEGVDRIQELQYHDSEEIFEKAHRIIRDYFNGEDEEDFELEPDYDDENQQFQFGADSDVGHFDFH
ncbi:hypothetical protein PINS_up013148 [Pythium insidiosum]|nr:hypothetical protein PINS_up013148 [Pythium insidiosum]